LISPLPKTLFTSTINLGRHINTAGSKDPTKHADAHILGRLKQNVVVSAMPLKESHINTNIQLVRAHHYGLRRLLTFPHVSDVTGFVASLLDADEYLHLCTSLR
jgi:hypothetical protein